MENLPVLALITGLVLLVWAAIRLNESHQYQPRRPGHPPRGGIGETYLDYGRHMGDWANYYREQAETELDPTKRAKLLAQAHECDVSYHRFVRAENWDSGKGEWVFDEGLRQALRRSR